MNCLEFEARGKGAKVSGRVLDRMSKWETQTDKYIMENRTKNAQQHTNCNFITLNGCCLTCAPVAVDARENVGNEGDGLILEGNVRNTTPCRSLSIKSVGKTKN